MPIRVNNSDSYPGANSIFAVPVTKADCCLFQTRQEMGEHAVAEGWPYTIKGGACMVDASLGQIQTVCLIGEPVISSLTPDPLEVMGPWAVYGPDFGSVEGEVWLGSHDTWEASSTKVKQNVSEWHADNLIMGVPVQDGLPVSPSHVYVYVINGCGERNAVGFETELLMP